MTVAGISAVNIQLPRLIYIGDVPVASTVAGSMLLYRLLQNYPDDCLMVVESNLAATRCSDRVAGVNYKSFYLGFKRLLHSRFARIYVFYLLITARQKSKKLDSFISKFQPDAILTVAHGFSWLTAARLAEKYDLPLHLIVHDDWVSSVAVIERCRWLAARKFGEVYHQAASRLCVSPYMAEFYEQQYGVKGDVLYPARGGDIPVFDYPANQRLNHHSDYLVFAYAGSVNSAGYANSLVQLSSVLESKGDRLLIYSPLEESSIQQLGLNKPHVSVYPLSPSQELIRTLREEADVLFVPMSFEESDRRNMEMSFPSKLTDYTAIGLPLLIWGPPYCSAVRWVKHNPGVAIVVEQPEIEYLSRAVEALNEPTDRSHLASLAMLKGKQYFSHEQSIQKFYGAIGKDLTVTSAIFQ